jgi:hypothetical protein
MARQRVVLRARRRPTQLGMLGLVYSDAPAGALANLTENMLVPFPYEPAWTSLGDGVFNERPDALAPTLNTENPNAVTTTTTGITANTPSNLALLTANPRRRLLLLQNNSTATSPASAPTFYIAFGQQASAGTGLGLPPGVGLVLDTACPIDAVYVTFGPYTAPATIVGCAVEGIAPPGIAGTVSGPGTPGS